MIIDDDAHPWDAFRWFVDLSMEAMSNEFPDEEKDCLLEGCHDECSRIWPTLTDEQKLKFEQMAQIDTLDEKRRKKLKKRKMKERSEKNECTATSEGDLDLSWTVHNRSHNIELETSTLNTTQHNGSPKLKKTQLNGSHAQSPLQIKAEVSKSPKVKKAVQNGEENDDGESAKRNDDGESAKKKKKKKRDPNMPKQGLSAFFIYMSDHREQLKAANPDFGNPEIAKELSRRWKELTEEEKQPYLTRQEEDKIRYNEEMVEYKSSLEAANL